MSETRILHGDCRTVLPTLEEKSVQTCVTSPPYWGLRDYGTATWLGGDDACEHSASPVKGVVACLKCGAMRQDSQIGLEATPSLYVETLVNVFREVRRVLKDDGTLWLNLGDSYARAAEKGQHKPGDSGKQGYVYDRGGGRASACMPKTSTEGSHDGVVRRGESSGQPRVRLRPQAEDLVGIPWRVAFALQRDGWFLRSDVIWEKLNPMPESVLDRPTKAHEYVFLLSKSERYFYDADAIAEEATGRDPGNRVHRGAHAYEHGDEHHRTKGGLTEVGARTKKNKRSVWTIGSEPYSGAHFAVMPTALAVPCVLAGSRIGDTVLDPFGGSGTTGTVANELGRNAVLVELNEEFISLGHERTAQIGLFG